MKKIAILIAPLVAAIDYQPAHTIFRLLPHTQVHFVWKDKAPMMAFPGNQPIQATCTFEECPRDLDVLLVPAIPNLLEDAETLSFLEELGQKARFVTSVCGGSQLLAAAGLLDGYRVANSVVGSELIVPCGAIPVDANWVEDGNRITARGGSGSYEHAFLLVERLYDKELARQVRTLAEWQPETLSSEDRASHEELIAQPWIQTMVKFVIEGSRAPLEAAGQRLKARKQLATTEQG